MATRKINLDGAQSTVRATVARALAEAAVSGVDNARQEGHPLTLLQQIDVTTMHIMAYDNALNACEGLEVMSMLEATVAKPKRSSK